MTNRRSIAAWFLASGLLCAAVLAAPAQSRAQAGRPGGPMDEDLQETIEIYMIARMTRFLELSDEQERAVIPAIEELNSSRRELNRQRRLTMMKLQPLVEDESSADEAIASILADLERLEEDHRSVENRTRAVIRESLTPRQQARFLFFQERFRTEMRDRMRRLRGDAPGPHGRQRRIP